MNLNQLRVFHAVATAGSVTQAAKELRVSQPAVSKQLRELEQDLDLVLCERGARGVQLTDAGERLLHHATRVFAAEQAAEAEVAALKDLAVGSLRVGASTTIANYLVPNLFARYRRTHPEIELGMEIANTAQVLEWVLAGRVDLGLTEGFVESPSLTAEVFADDEMVVIARPDHPLLSGAGAASPSGQRTKMTAELPELVAYPMIQRELGSGSRAVIEAALRARGVQVIPGLSLGSTEAVKTAVAAGMGWAMVSRIALELELGTRRLVEVSVPDFRVRRSLHLVRQTGRPDSPAVSEFVRQLAPAPPRQSSYVI